MLQHLSSPPLLLISSSLLSSSPHLSPTLLPTQHRQLQANLRDIIVQCMQHGAFIFTFIITAITTTVAEFVPTAIMPLSLLTQ
jgi:hypothetical protein